MFFQKVVNGNYFGGRCWLTLDSENGTICIEMKEGGVMSVQVPINVHQLLQNSPYPSLHLEIQNHLYLIHFST